MPDSADTRLAVLIVRAVLGDLQGRKGFDWFWSDLDADIRREIRHALIAVVREQLPASTLASRR